MQTQASWHDDNHVFGRVTSAQQKDDPVSLRLDRLVFIVTVGDPVTPPRDWNLRCPSV